MVKLGLEVTVEAGAGSEAHFTDTQYEEAGATIGDASGWSTADIVLTVGPLGTHDALGKHEAAALKQGALVFGFLAPYTETETMRTLADRGVTSLAVELVPRISRAQSMDALSSQANIGGYKAVLLAAGRLDRYFPLLMTAAGTIPPSRVVIMGAGVAGLQAIATAKRLGAVVEVSDIRPVVKEQVESLGGKFIELPLEESGEGEGGYAKEMGEDFLRKQREIVQQHLAEADVAVTTALVPGKKAPTLITREMVEAMRPGAVIVDMAVAQGGNCELSEPGREVVHNGVLILGPENLAAEMPHDASMLYARNLLNLLSPMIQDGQLTVDLDDEVVAGSLVTHGGKIHHPALAEKIGATKEVTS
jgi:NAD(P) transhydrogenase subunit alpha